jgi:hypothetical protein
MRSPSAGLHLANKYGKYWMAFSTLAALGLVLRFH